MQLSSIFAEAIKESDRLLLYYRSLCSKKTKKPKSTWSDKFYLNKIVAWPKKEGFWRAGTKDQNLLLVANDSALMTMDDLQFETVSVLLRSALVMAMAAVDKILHEAVTSKFGKLLSSASLDAIVNIPLSDSYEIAIKSRERRGRGGAIRVRPGHMFKEKILVELYKKTFLSTTFLETICKACDSDTIFTRYSQSLNPPIPPKELRDRWSKMYTRRNAIAHECDIVRKEKTKKVTFHKSTEAELLADIAFVRSFGAFLASQL